MIRRKAAPLALMLVVTCRPGLAAQDHETCLEAMHQRVQSCAGDCVSKARAAVDPSVRDLVIGRACVKNCLKIEMVQGRSCP